MAIGVRSSCTLLLASLWVGGCGITCAPSLDVDVDAKSRSAGPSSAGAQAPTCPGPEHSGITSCFPSECAVGQYCVDEPMSSCRPGCASDASCGPRETCVREGAAAIGRCEACADHIAHAPAAGCGATSRTGVTSCFPSECPVGQRCVDGGIPHCEPGCVSDENCGATESCVREGSSALGVCRSCFF